jgi:hypothetical protein
LVGGAARMPFLLDKFRETLKDKLIELDVVGLDPVHPIVLGLARHQQLDRVALRYPNWAVQAILAKDGQEPVATEVYQPFAPLFKMSYRGATAHHQQVIDIPPSHRGGTVQLSFRPVVKSPGEQWPPVTLPTEVERVVFSVDLFGNVFLVAGKKRLYADRTSPFALRDDGRPRSSWIPEAWREKKTIGTMGEESWRYELD